MSRSVPPRELRVRRRAGILSRAVEEEAILLNPDSGTYYATNEVARRVWELAADAPTLEEIHRVLMAEYDVDAETLRRDLADLVERLRAEELVDVEVG